MNNPQSPTTESIRRRKATGKQRASEFRESVIPPLIKIYANGTYYPSWYLYQGVLPSSLNLEVISHVFYASASIQPDGTIYLRDRWADTQVQVDNIQGCLRSFVSLKQRYGFLKILLSIGGSSSDGKGFPILAGNATSRENFGRNARDLVMAYNLDGIDIAWNYPSTPQQSEDYLQLTRTARAYLPWPHHCLTATFPVSSAALNNHFLLNVCLQLDFLNVLAYSSSDLQPPQDGVCVPTHSAIEYLLTLGVPSRKILLGFHTSDEPATTMVQVAHNSTIDGEQNGRGWEYPSSNNGLKGRHQGWEASSASTEGDYTIWETSQSIHEGVQLVKSNGLGGLLYCPQSCRIETLRSIMYDGYTGLHSSLVPTTNIN